MSHNCFKQGCEFEVQYLCQCFTSMTYSCELHLQDHLKLPNRTHCFDSILAEPSELTKDTILKFLTKEKTKKEKLKEIVKGSFKNASNNAKIILNDLNSKLKEINSLIKKISRGSEKNLLLNSFKSPYNTDIKKIMLTNDTEPYAGVALYFQLGYLKNKKYEILNRINNNPETEQDFRTNSSLFENNSSNALLSQAHEEYISAYQKITSTYLIDKEGVHIYNTETEKEELRVLEVPDDYEYYGPSAKLPNGELFFIGSKNYSSNAFILDRNYQIRKLPRCTPSVWFGAIYFDRSIYCFGENRPNILNLSRKFDLDQNRWTKLLPISKKLYGFFNSVVFNRNILISMYDVCEILSYSIDIDSFSEIPYKFANDKKILINGIERLYVIERKGWIYESEIGDEYSWKPIRKSIIQMYPMQLCCSYNKEGIYISILHYNSRNYFKFDLNQKALIEIAFLSENIGLQRSGDKTRDNKLFQHNK